MGRDGIAQARCPAGALHHRLQATHGVVFAGVLTLEEPVLRLVILEAGPEHLQQHLRAHDAAVFLAFALHYPDRPPLGLHVFAAQLVRLAGAQPRERTADEKLLKRHPALASLVRDASVLLPASLRSDGMSLRPFLLPASLRSDGMSLRSIFLFPFYFLLFPLTFNLFPLALSPPPFALFPFIS